MRSNFVERRGRIEQMDRSFDLKFWRAQPPKARFDAVWKLIIHAMKVKGQNDRQLRLQRSVTLFGREKYQTEIHYSEDLKRNSLNDSSYLY